MKRLDEVDQVRNQLKCRVATLIRELDTSIDAADADLVKLDKFDITLKVTDVRAILNKIMDLREV